MKAESLVTIIIRLFAILVCLQSAFVAAAPTLLSLLFTAPTSMSTGLFQSAPGASGMAGVSGIIGVNLMIAAITFVFGVLLYIWSRPLGRLIAHGLE